MMVMPMKLWVRTETLNPVQCAIAVMPLINLTNLFVWHDTEVADECLF